jgi:EAL domain-containing protein (putative c-di-GMP-specific phosphodiesterase class I)
VLDGHDVSSAAVVGRAMTAPSLAEAGARVRNADLVALFEDEQRCFHSVFQRIVTLADSQVIGHEALLRAETLTGDLVMPDVLFPAAEAAGWIHLLDRVGRTTALRDAGPWLGDDLLFINFVPTSIYRPEVCLRTTEAAAVQAGVRLDQLVFEVTEGHKVEDVDHLERVFDYYRSQQCRVALDDLGSGYSSLNLLVRLQPDIVKLDKEIVQALPGPTSTAVVAAIVEMVHSYGGLVLAECVETDEQAAAASGLGVDLAQGWLFGRPERHVVVGPSPRAMTGPPRPVPAQPHLPDAAVAVAVAVADPSEGPPSGTTRTSAHQMVERSTADTFGDEAEASVRP